jgi:hypothetical protein
MAAFPKLDWQSANGPKGRHWRRRAGMLHIIVAAQIEAFDRNAIAIFALHKCG